MFVCLFPGSGGLSAEEKYRMFMRHRYNSCVEMLLEHLNHELHCVKVSGLEASWKWCTHTLDKEPCFS